MLSWILTTYLGRRTIYVWGSAFNTFLLVMLGVAASVPVVSQAAQDAASLAQASLGLIISVLFTLGPAPASWVIIGETSAIRLRPLTTGIGRGCYYIVNIPCIFLSSYMLNPEVRLLLPSRTCSRVRFLTHLTGRQPRRQVRLRLGRHRPPVLCCGILLLARDEGQVVPRNRHSVQAQGAGSPVEEDSRRRSGRFVDGRRDWVSLRETAEVFVELISKYQHGVPIYCKLC